MEPGKRLPGKVAIITGGASGIGEATARLFADHGATAVFATCRTSWATVSRVRSSLRADRRNTAISIPLQEDDWVGLVEAVEGKYGRIDVLCNVAGIGSGSRHDQRQESPHGAARPVPG